MKPGVTTMPYPEVAAPAYPRWLLAGAVLLGLLASGAVALRSWVEPALLLLTGTVAVLLWVLALTLRVLRYRLNRHNAQCYSEAIAFERQAWWERHRQKVALLQSVLVSPVCAQPEQVTALFEAGAAPSAALAPPQAHAIRLAQVLAPEGPARECELAVLLALKWQAIRDGEGALQPVSCYWQGSAAGWQAFRAQLALCSPEVVLPEQPLPWEGLRSLDAIIDRLHAAPAGTRILCAGCQSTVAEIAQPMPAGEAAVLWLLGKTGRVMLPRGEWLAAGAEPLATVAERALEQSEMDAPATVCASLSQPGDPDQAALLWRVKAQRQDAHFGALGGLEALVMQTLAAWYAEQHGAPCAWLASDPEHALTLGIVTVDDSNN
ncbi:hypothetical protein F3J44_01975 [Pantoea sp. Tr-811]|uniref:hypothetical protein n=1 Tax=Pantoea sp. Tr-811 TaxID=2608361 RepID=UPI001420D279|nr:hypothetical protein [Pantoea sp. Tr-811]NIF25142.1 hypothetical protein [Pantoea sp. Tr-811]